MSMYKKLIGSLTISLLFLLSATPSFAQQNDVKVTGKITDGSGAPLAGVVVVVKDGKSNNGAVSNTQGVYEIKVPASSTLLFTCLGYTDQEVKLGASNVVNVTMTEDAQSLDEVVVVGYGTQKKASVVASLSSATAKDIMKAPVGNVGSALTGRLTGLTTMQNSGQPGAEAPTIRIRGKATLNNADPLVIVDGVERSSGGRIQESANADLMKGYMSGWETINPNDIESVTILKDASATAV